MSGVGELLPALRDFMFQLPPDQRATANNFWRRVRGALSEQASELSRLQAVVDSLSAGPSASRPPTSQSVIRLRDAVDQVIGLEARQAEDASATIEEICDLPVLWAMEFAQRQRSADNRLHPHELGCWESGNVAAHDNGYIKMNMRNTVKPGAQGEKFRCQPWGHQMGIVAGGYGYLLRLTTDGAYNVGILS